ncbi:MAG TPA: HAMP domain-containing sensor histidine kinase [Thermomicrobiales bacterium]|jgi:signal transduction histidine kinase
MNGRFTLPIRRWLAIALVITLCLPLAVTMSVAASRVRGPWNGQTDAIRLLRDDAARWNDPTWQRTMRERLAAERIAFVLYSGEREIYRSTADPIGPSQFHSRTVQRIIVTGADDAQTALIYSDTQPTVDGNHWVIPFAALAALVLTLAAIGWFLRRMVLRPLAATSRAARQIAVGDLDVRVPDSRVREVAEVSAAFEAMGVALRGSLRRQAAIEQERRIFIGAIVHDLRTPLFSLRGYLEGLAEGVADTPEKRSRYVAVAQEKALALERLVADLFDYTRLEYLEQAPNPQPLDLGALLLRAVEGLRPRAEAKGLTVELETAPSPSQFEADEHLLTRAIENLLDNAIRYTPEGGRVRVVGEADGQGISFSVHDNGPGIPPADLPHLFTPLYRGESSRNRRTGGAGLGLTIARRIIRAHGGDLQARNGSEGGAIFTASLPTARHSSLIEYL